MAQAIPAIIGGAATLAGSAASSKAAGEVSDASTAASRAQLEQYYQTRQDFAPWREAGTAALSQMMGLLGVPQSAQRSPLYGTPKPVYDPPTTKADGKLMAPGFLAVTASGMPGVSKKKLANFITGGGITTTDNGNYDELYQNKLREWELAQQEPVAAPAQAVDPLTILQNTPGYQFQLSEGIKAADRSAGARGMLQSGAQQKSLLRYGQGVANQEFNNYLNRLASIAGLGQSATGATANFGANAVGAAGGYGMQGAMANAGNYINQANVLGNFGNQMAQWYGSRQSGYAPNNQQIAQNNMGTQNMTGKVYA